MKSLLIIAIVSLLTGILLTFLGYTFKVMHWPFSSQAIIAGLCLLVFGVVTLIFSLVKKRNS